MKERGYNVCSTQPKVTCKVFEDNEEDTELAIFPKMRQRTKNINQMHHQFRSYVSNGDVDICPIDTKV